MKKQKQNSKLKKALEQYASALDSGSENVKKKAAKEIQEESVKIQKALHRARLMELGFYGIHKHKLHKSKKTYTRKNRINKESE